MSDNLSDNDLLKTLSKVKQLSNGEKKIAQYLEANYPQVMMYSITELSDKCKVSISAISRFIKKLGYADFADFRKKSQIVMSDRLQSPIKRYNSKTSDTGGYQAIFAKNISNMEETMLRVDESDVKSAIKILINADTLYIAGGASAQTLAKYFSLLAHYLRARVHYIEPDISTMAHHLVDMTQNDALLVISQYRSSSVITRLAQLFHAKKCEILLISDRQSSPLTPYASVNLVVCSETNSLFNSRVVTLAMLEALINGMLPYCKDELKDRFALMEEIFEMYDVYSK